MNGAPPLVYFTLGALYNKIGDYKSAVNHLSYVLENENADEQTYLYPSPDLRNYAKVLRKIEREPAEAPQTSAAVRALERIRRNRGKSLLEKSRVELEKINEKKREALKEQENQASQLAENSNGKTAMQSITNQTAENNRNQNSRSLFDESGETHKVSVKQSKQPRRGRKKKKSKEEDLFSNRKPITEVLHDIYDKNST